VGECVVEVFIYVVLCGDGTRFQKYL